MELYISDHPLDCLTCAANGDCELQDMAGAVGLREVRYGYEGANHLDAAKDVSNPYFTFDPAKCIVCSRCVRACEEVQGTFALTIDGARLRQRVSPGGTDFLGSECVSCGACVQACPTATLIEKSVIEMGQPEHAVVTTCAYCGVGCSFKAEMQGEQVVRMVPFKDGQGQRGPSCVKGRFAWGYATHKDRITKPMIREKITDPWREVSWDEAIGTRPQRVQAHPGAIWRDCVGGITSSRCTNEETFLVQKLIRAAFGNNNVDTCARVCHSPTGYGLKTTFGTSAGTQDFKSVEQVRRHPGDRREPDRRASRLRLAHEEAPAPGREADRGRSAPHRPREDAACRGRSSPAAPAGHERGADQRHRACDRDGRAGERGLRARALRPRSISRSGRASSPRSAIRPRRAEALTGVPAAEVRAAARLYATGGNAAIYYGLGVTEHSQGSTMVMGMANLAMATGNIGRDGVGVNPLRGQNNVQGACDMGSFPHEFSGYRHVSDDATRDMFEALWGVPLSTRAGPAHSQHARRGRRRHLQGPLHPGRGHRPVRSQHAACRGRAARRWNASSCRTCS